MKLFSKKNFSSLTSHFSFQKGFTLIELLIVIAILGILAAGIVVVINPMEKINSANLAKAKTFAAGVENSLVMSQVGKWSFNDQASPGLDTSGYGNKGTLNGGAVWQTSAQCGLELGGCLKFDGVDDYVDVGSGASLNIAGAITVEAWVYPEKIDCSTNATCTLWSNNGAVDGGDIIAIKEDGFLWFYSIVDGAWNNLLSTIPLSLNTWQHVVFVGDGQTKKIYINGVERGSKEAIGSMRGFVPFWIGRKYSSHAGYWDGLMDEVSIYNKALLSYQIQQLYAQGLVKHLLALK